MALLTCCLVAAGCATTITGAAVPVAGAITCAGGTVIQPKGAPYCYLLPDGFTDTSDKITLQYQGASPARYLSAVEVAQYDTITVSVFPLRANSDPLSATELSTVVTDALAGAAATGISAGQPGMTSLNGARTVQITVRKTGGQFTATTYFAFRGFTELEINCQWAQHKSDIDRGCASIRDTIRFADPPR